MSMEAFYFEFVSVELWRVCL